MDELTMNWLLDSFKSCTPYFFDNYLKFSIHVFCVPSCNYIHLISRLKVLSEPRSSPFLSWLPNFVVDLSSCFSFPKSNRMMKNVSNFQLWNFRDWAGTTFCLGWQSVAKVWEFSNSTIKNSIWFGLDNKVQNIVLKQQKVEVGATLLPILKTLYVN